MYILYRKNFGTDVFCFKTEQECIDFKNKNLNYKIYYCSLDLAFDLYFYEAIEWHDEIDIPFINLEKAKLIHLIRLKYKRENYFKFLDIEFIKAIETENDARKNLIKNLKQELRDLNSSEFPNNFKQLREYKPKVFLDIEELF